MQKFKMLVLTDHTNHSSENSLYALVHAMRKHPRCSQIDIATRGDSRNHFFFDENMPINLWAVRVDESFRFQSDGASFKKEAFKTMLRSYDVVWLRMPPPLSFTFLYFLKKVFTNQIIINDPEGIWVTGSKSFLMQFETLCAPMRICRSIDDIIQFKNQFPIVLKPFREYGGKGIIKIDNNQVWEGQQVTSFQNFISKLQSRDQPLEYLGVQFLKNVHQGDKRIIVVNGKVLGASLRLPAENSWLCNVAMGGRSVSAQPDEDELAIIESINPILNRMGIVMYGVDTLMGNNGQRVLSEINTTSIGGVPQMAQQTGLPLVKIATDLMWNYIIEKSKNEHVIDPA